MPSGTGTCDCCDTSPAGRVLVAGDLFVHQLLAAHEPHHGRGILGGQLNLLSTYQDRAGAWRIYDLLAKLCAGFEDVSVGIHDEKVDPEKIQEWHLQISPFGTEGAKKWRARRALGSKLNLPTESHCTVEKAYEPPAPAIVVLNDDHGGVRNSSSLPRLAKDLQEAQHIVVRTCPPLARGRLWTNTLNQPGLASKVTAIVNVGHLQQEELSISRVLSWEHTVEQLARAVFLNPLMNRLLGCKRIVISFDEAGAVLFTRGSETPDKRDPAEGFRAQVLFHPWSTETHFLGPAGAMVGGTSLITASVAYRLLTSQNTLKGLINCNDEEKDYYLETVLSRGIRLALSAMHVAHAEGYKLNEGKAPRGPYPLEKVSGELRHCLTTFNVDSNGRHVLPSAGPAVRYGAFKLHEGKKPRPGIALRTILPSQDLSNQSPSKQQKKLALPRRPYWSILNVRLSTPRGAPRSPADEAERIGLHIIRSGPEAALQGVPLGKFGSIFSADRAEIEGYRSVLSLINDYVHHQDEKKPLSIIVHAQPGSGKSFAVQQIAREVLGENIEPLTFNLSQFNHEDSTALVGPMHRIRDSVLRGHVPLVLWDEYDNHNWTWIDKFLAPMQDGVFQEGTDTHPIGRCIFIFVGGKCFSQAYFSALLTAKLPDLKSTKNEDLATFSANAQSLRGNKGSDFFSRLKGHIDVPGVNKRQVQLPSTLLGPVDETEDYGYILRRAMLIRSMLNKMAGHLLTSGGSLHEQENRLDSGVLKALLTTSEFRNGARSIEAILACSSLNQGRFTRACLPSASILEHHVDADEFLNIVSYELSGITLESVASALYQLCSERQLVPTETFKSYQHFASLPALERDFFISLVKRLLEVLTESKVQSIQTRTWPCASRVTHPEVQLNAKLQEELKAVVTDSFRVRDWPFAPSKLDHFGSEFLECLQDSGVFLEVRQAQGPTAASPKGAK